MLIVWKILFTLAQLVIGAMLFLAMALAFALGNTAQSALQIVIATATITGCIAVWMNRPRLATMAAGVSLLVFAGAMVAIRSLAS